MSFSYRLGCSAIRAALAVGPLADGLSAFSRIWSRHARIHQHLKSACYDGVIDGGANIGEFAGLVRAALPDADLVCVEPHPGCAATLRKSGYRVVEAALWSSTGRITLTQPAEATTSCSVVEPANESVGTWEVETVRLEDLELSGSRIFLKLDLQGAELEAFHGMDRLWSRCAGILCEVSLAVNPTYEQIRALLAERNFREVSTFNELEEDGRVIEADKLWLSNDRR